MKDVDLKELRRRAAKSKREHDKPPRRVVVEVADLSSIIWSTSCCKFTAVPARWSRRSKKWVCQVHGRSRCVETFKNMDLLDRAAGRSALDAEHPSWPSDEEVAQRREWLKRTRTYHSFRFWVTQPLSLEEYSAVFEELEEVFQKRGIKVGADGGPIPLEAE